LLATPLPLELLSRRFEQLFLQYTLVTALKILDELLDGWNVILKQTDLGSQWSACEIIWGAGLWHISDI
jgi:hypothetical protein